jgi:hypothetical protein
VAKLYGKLSDTPYEANRALALISAVWNWAARRGEVAFADNPAKAIERYPEQRTVSHERRTSLARLGAALKEGETIGLPYASANQKPGQSTRESLTGAGRG